MMDPDQTRRRRQPSSRPPIKFNFNRLRRILLKILAGIWRVVVPILWLAAIGCLIIGVYFGFGQVGNQATPTINLTNALSSAKSEETASGDQQFDTTLTQTQQLGLLARWSNKQATGNYTVYMGTANTIYFEHQNTANAWINNTFKIVDNHDGTYVCYYATTNTPDTATISNVTWTPADAISKSSLLHRYQNDAVSYAARIDLTHQNEAGPTH